eukprot:13300848-Alexandrium_andersonii.AAC.1
MDEQEHVSNNWVSLPHACARADTERAVALISPRALVSGGEELGGLQVDSCSSDTGALRTEHLG